MLGWQLAAGGGARAAGNDWLGALPDATRLSAITLPGTHNAGARFEPLAGTAKCQEAMIAAQLAFGVRVLDIRCRHVNDAFLIHHGPVYQKLDFPEVLRQVRGFLADNPRECVVMSVKEEHQAAGNTRSFEATFDSYLAADRARWYLRAGLPVLGDVRGRIVLLRRFGATRELGLDASRWRDNTTFQQGILAVQDHYQVADPAAKWRQIAAALAAAHEPGAADLIHLNFASGYQPGTFGLPNIPVVAKAINPRLADHFRSAKPGCHGWVMMDFATAELTALIYQANAPGNAVPDPGAGKPAN
jgi:1-phosphatidylinositol phosphodiesterase